MQVFDAVSGERRRRCGWMRCFGGDVGSVLLIWCFCLYLYLRRYKQASCCFSSTAGSGPLFTGRQRADTPPFSQQRHGAGIGTQGPPKSPRGALLVPVPVLGLYPLGPKNGATHLPPTLMRYESPSPAPATVERAGLERHCKRLGCHHSDCDHTAGALFSLAAKAWRLHHLCHSVTAFLFFNFFAPARLD